MLGGAAAREAPRDELRDHGGGVEALRPSLRRTRADHERDLPLGRFRNRAATSAALPRTTSSKRFVSSRQTATGRGARPGEGGERPGQPLRGLERHVGPGQAPLGPEARERVRARGT